MPFSPEIATFCIFAGVAIGTYMLLALVDPYWMRVRSRVKDLQSQGSGGENPSGATTASAGNWSLVALRRLGGPAVADKTQLTQRLVRAGIYQENAVLTYLATRIALTALPPVVSVACGLLGYVRMDAALLVGCFLGGVGTIVPGFWLDRVTVARHLQLRVALPDFLDLMIVCLEGGLSLQETIRRVSGELQLAHPELAFELSVVQRDIELGATVDQALKRFAARSDYEGVRSLSTFIREAQRFGTNITEALRGHADMMRSQREQAAEERAQKASVKILIPTMLLIFPAIFVVLVGPAAVQIYQAFGK